MMTVIKVVAAIIVAVGLLGIVFIIKVLRDLSRM